MNSHQIQKRPVAAWECGDKLILSMPSSRGGHYLVGVKPTGDGRLMIAHRCTATVHRKRCWHMKAAYEAYKAWRWWETVPERVVFVDRVITLSPEWVQIPVPGYELEGIIDDERLSSA